MTTINLHQSFDEQESKKNKVGNFFDGNFIFSIALFVLVAVAISGMKIYASQLASENDKLATEIAAGEAKGLTGKMVDDVADFQGRLDLIKSRNEKNLEINTVLAKVSSAMISETSLDKLSYKSKENNLELGVKTKDYRSVAEQLLGFKISENKDGVSKAKNFSQVEIGGIKRDEKGVTFSFTMNVNK